MNGKALLANLLASCGIGAAAAATAGSVASGAPGLSTEDQTAGTESLEKLVEAAHEEGRKAGVTEGRKAERERFGAVLTNPDTEGRLGLAISLLSTTDLDAETVMSNVKASPKIGEPPKPVGALGTGTGEQQPERDPLATGGDQISADTGIVEPGKPGTTGDAGDQASVDNLWKGAFAATGPGITEGGIWSGTALDGQRPN